MYDFCQLWLTCKNKQEADKISNSLLDKHLVACAKQIPVSSDFHWQDKIEKSEEIMLVMDSKPELFDQVEAEVTKFHSYDTFVLEAVAVTRVSKKASKWLEQELANGKR